MSNKLIYLEPDEEITSVINRIRHSDEAGVILVIPRGGTIGQSIVNLKLLVRNAAALTKSIGLVTSDKITTNLASQLEIKSFGKVSEAEKAQLAEPAKKRAPERRERPEDGEGIVEGLKVHTYEKYSGEDESHSAPSSAEATDDREATRDANAEGGELAEEEDEGHADEIIEEDEEDDLVEEESDQPDPEEETPRSARVSRDANAEEEDSVPLKPVPKRHFKTEGSRKPFLIILAISLILILAVSYLLIPYAEASIILETKDIVKESAFTADRTKEEIDEKNAIIPATMVDAEKEESKQYPTAGKKDVGTKARGIVTVSNTVSTDNQILPAGTKATAADGEVFVLEKGISIPGAKLENCRLAGVAISCDTVAGTADATVIASENGDQYNIESTKFTVGRLAGESKAAFTGGVTKEIRHVLEEDIKKAEEDLKASLSTALKTQINERAAEAGLKIADESLNEEIILFESNKKADEEAESFEVKMKLKLFSLGFKESELKDAVLQAVESELGEDQMLVARDKAEINYTITSANVNEGIIRLNLSFKGRAGRKMDSSAIISRINNQKSSLALNYLEGLEGVSEAELKITPSFFKWTPLLSKRIKVKFDYQESDL